MKTVLTFFTMSMLLPLLAVGQEINFGARAGANISSISFTSDTFDTSSKVGFHFGGFANFEVSNDFSVQPELIFVKAGGKESRPGASGEIYTSNLNIPIFGRYQINDNISLEAGPYFNLLLSIKEEFGSDPEPNVTTVTLDRSVIAINNNAEDISEFYKTGNFGIILGASYKLDSLLEGLEAGLRYGLDLSRMNKIEVAGGDLKARNLFFTFAYNFSAGDLQ